MTTAATFGPQGLPPGMTTGLLAGLGAGAFWGMTFVAPLMAQGFDAVDYTAGRFLACGLFALLLLGWARVRSAWGGGVAMVWPSWQQAGMALLLSLLGYTGYYLLLVLAIADAGAALPVLVIGTIPLAIMLLGKPTGLRWVALAPALVLTTAGLVLMMRVTMAEAGGGGAVGSHGLRGLFFAACAMASWTAFGLLNAAWLRRHPHVPSATWANWLGVAAGMGALLLWSLWGSAWADMARHPDFWRFVLVCTVTGIGSAWVAAVLWNMASRRLSASLAGQLIVSETVFGLIYTFAWNGQWPAPIQWMASVLFVLGILAAIRAHR
jgi:drug/metabolite transporter (DMT)-like permease